MAKNKSSQNTYTTNSGSDRAEDTTNSAKSRAEQNRAKDRSTDKTESKSSEYDCHD